MEDTPRVLVKCEWCGGSVDVLATMPPPDVTQLMRQVDLFRSRCFICLDEGGHKWWTWCPRVW